ncbi:MAG: hypothetical protein CVT80_00385 [Alphaproteobacteria bacterium HGW-Alphaproteobacteria-2]|nr:MAG: hypothetical protein CVT80_00385 [Alphaproteobacteria bacterium HGW-Alphaproteobacteria-2]
MAALAALAGLGALVLWALASPAEAQAACGGRSEMVRRLAQGFGEVQVGSGLSGERIVEVWAAPDGGTWTILVTTPGGISCLAAAGEGWVAAPDVPVGEPM